MNVVRARAERFGGIVELASPRALLHVDQEMMRELGYPESKLWDLPEGALSAPREVHVVLSRKCAAGCKGCYVDATPQGAALSYQEACRILDELAAMGVFHVALGGGEALELDYLFAVAEHARRVGITPNLTTSGLGLDEAAARKCAIFGQINVSVDGVGAAYAEARGFDLRRAGLRRRRRAGRRPARRRAHRLLVHLARARRRPRTRRDAAGLAHGLRRIPRLRPDRSRTVRLLRIPEALPRRLPRSL